MTGAMQLMMKYPPLVVTGGATRSGTGSTIGTHTIGAPVVLTASGGTGTYAYGTATLVSGFNNSGNGTTISCVQTTNSYQFRAVATATDATPCDGVWRIPVNDGVTTITTDIPVNWN